MFLYTALRPPFILTEFKRVHNNNSSSNSDNNTTTSAKQHAYTRTLRTRVFLPLFFRFPSPPPTQVRNIEIPTIACVPRLLGMISLSSAQKCNHPCTNQVNVLFVCFFFPLFHASPLLSVAASKITRAVIIAANKTFAAITFSFHDKA